MRENILVFYGIVSVRVMLKTRCLLLCPYKSASFYERRPGEEAKKHGNSAGRDETQQRDAENAPPSPSLSTPPTGLGPPSLPFSRQLGSQKTPLPQSVSPTR